FMNGRTDVAPIVTSSGAPSAPPSLIEGGLARTATQGAADALPWASLLPPFRRSPANKESTAKAWAGIWKRS
ncbi:MAG: hypothetical protein DMG05_01385, partial [Acidobacteria bacterium]